jgi:serine/threonine protein kinase
LNFKIRWPKGFSGVAKDLVSKLLKSDPEQRISLSEILEHPWFQAHKPSKPQPSKSIVPQKLDPSGEIEKGKYAVISKPSLKNKAETVAEGKADQLNFSHLSKKVGQAETVIDDLNKKVTELTEENNELKVQSKLLNKEVENLKKENSELKEHLSKAKALGETEEESQQLLEEIQRLRSVKKDRDDLLQDLEARSKSMRQTETQLKMKQNDMEILNNQHQMALEKLEAYKKKIEKLEGDVVELRTRTERAEKEKESIEIDSKNKIEVLQYKLLNKLESDDKQDDVAFEELLNFCKADLEDILTRIQGKISNEDVEEELRKEIVDGAKKLNKMKTEYEQENYENLKKIDEVSTKVEEEKRILHKKYKEELDEKSHTIVKLKTIESKYKAETEKNNSLLQQLKELQDQNNALKLDVNVMKQEKALNAEKRKALSEKVQEYESKYPNHK